VEIILLFPFFYGIHELNPHGSNNGKSAREENSRAVMVILFLLVSGLYPEMHHKPEKRISCNPACSLRSEDGMAQDDYQV